MPYDTDALLALCRPTRLKLDHIGIRTLRSRDPLCWPSRGWVKMPDTDFGHHSECPKFPGDGVCAALSAYGAASGGYSLAEGVLIVGWNSSHVAGSTADKVRLSAAFVLGAAPLSAVVRAPGGNLSRANLSRADLSGANLYRANLSRANLYGAGLSGANLSRANLSRANLSGSDLYGADLYRADLSGANLYRADLYGANLSGADLSGANLSRANLYGADLSGANLSRANLSRANLSGTVGYTPDK